MKKLKTLTLACLPAAMLVCLASPAHAELNNLITNGDFEATTTLSTPGVVTGWTHGPGAYSGANVRNYVYADSNLFPDQLGVLQGHNYGKSLSQALTITSGVEHNFSFNWGEGGDHFRSASIKVDIFLASNLTTPIATSGWLSAANTPAATNVLFNSALSFIASEEDIVVTFSETSRNRVFVWLDDVILTSTALAEPSPFKSHAAISGGAINIAAGSTVNGDLAAQAAVVIGANAVIVHNIYAGAAVTTGALSTVENIFSGAAAGIGANAIAQNIHAGAAITVGASGQVQAVYAGAAITLGASASTTGVLTEDANGDNYAEAGDIHNAGNMTDMIALITDTQSALSDLVPSSANGPLSTTMGTRTLAPGVWEGSAVSIAASSTITFDADEYNDNADHVWVINLSDALTVGASTHFEIIGLDDTDTATIIWNVGAAFTMGAGTSFRGTAFVGGAVNAATSSVNCGHLYATGAISIGSIGVDSEGNAVTCENSDAVFTYLEALD
jgi:hypothetical protein